MTWKETEPVEQRKEFVRMYLKRRYEMTRLCALFEISRKTGYRTIARFEEAGWEGLKDRSSAPHSHPNATDPSMAERIIKAKKRHANWGPDKLLDWLRRKQPEELHWPAVSTAGEILKREGLVRPRPKRRAVTHPGKPRIEPITRANQLQNIDYKGEFRTGDGRWCYPLTLTDTFSRKLLVCRGFHQITFDNTQRALKAYFREHGIPDAMRMDNGNPFVIARSLAGLSRLGVWLIKVDIERIRTRPGSPQDNGLHERMHRTLKEETALPSAAHLRAQQDRFNHFMTEYNDERPHASLGGDTPSSHFSPSNRPYPERLPVIEYPAHFETRAIRKDGSFRWHQKLVFVSESLGDERIGLEETEYGIWSVYFGRTLLGVFDEAEGKVFGDRRTSNR